MDRPKLPPLRMALRQSIEDFDHQSRQSRRTIDSASTGGRLGLSALHSPGRRSAMLSSYSPSRPGDLSMYSLGSSPLSCTQSHLAASRNSTAYEPLNVIHHSPHDTHVPSPSRGGERTSSHSHSQPVSANPSHLPVPDMNFRRRSNSAVDLTSYQGFPPAHISEYHARHEFHQASPQISFLEGGSNSSPEGHHHRRQNRPSDGNLRSHRNDYPNPSVWIRDPFCVLYLSGCDALSKSWLNHLLTWAILFMNILSHSRSQNSPIYQLPQSVDQSESMNWPGGRSQIPSSSAPFPSPISQNQSNFTDPAPPPKWVCDYVGCGKTFTRGFNLTQHKAAIHRDERRFECA